MVEKRPTPLGGARRVCLTFLGILRKQRLTAAGLLVALSFPAFGCSSGLQKPPETAPKQARIERQEPKQQDQPTYEHVAPPPAYGNRVVMAEDERMFTDTF